MNGRLRDAMREIFEHVEARDALLGEQRGSPRLGLLQDGRDEIADLCFLTLRALDMEDGSLQRPAERGRLFGLALLSAWKAFNRVVQTVADGASQQGKVGAAGC